MLGTTGIGVPYPCSSWIHSTHRASSGKTAAELAVVDRSGGLLARVGSDDP
jgi:hypothetical protein